MLHELALHVSKVTGEDASVEAFQNMAAATNIFMRRGNSTRHDFADQQVTAVLSVTVDKPVVSFHLHLFPRCHATVRSKKKVCSLFNEWHSIAFCVDQLSADFLALALPMNSSLWVLCPVV